MPVRAPLPLKPFVPVMLVKGPVKSEAQSPTTNQRKLRKAKRRAHAAGKRHAFA